MCAVVVGYTPEGLPIAVTMTLTIVARRMAKHNVLVKDLSIIETFNTISLICSDKTGTITVNKMAVRTIRYGISAAHEKISAGTATSEKDAHDRSQTNGTSTGPHNKQMSLRPVAEMVHPALKQLFRCASLCNNAVRELVVATASNPQSTRIKGDASDTALYLWANSMTDLESTRDAHPIVAQLPFNSKNKFAISVHTQPATEGEEGASVLPSSPQPMLLFLKGAPEIVLSRCASMLDASGHVVPMLDSDRARWLSVQDEIGGAVSASLASPCSRLIRRPTLAATNSICRTWRSQTIRLQGSSFLDWCR